MTETQILTIAIALLVPFFGVLVGVLINNSRLNDVKDVVSAKLANCATSKELADFRGEMLNFRADTRESITEIRSLVERNHSELMLKIVEVENRRVRP